MTGKRPYRLRRKLARLPAFIAVNLALLVVGSWLTLRHTNNEFRSELLLQARLVAQSINIDKVRSLSGTERDIEHPAYHELKNQLIAIGQANPRCKWFYLMGRKPDGSVFFYMDSESIGSTDPTLPGHIYDEISDDYLGVFNNKAAAVVGPVTDRWGTWISALVPLLDNSTGEVVAVLGMDIEANHWNWDLLVKSSLTIGLILVILIGALVIFLSVNRSGRTPKPVLRRLLPPLTFMILTLLGGVWLLLFLQHRQRLAGDISTLNSNLISALHQTLNKQESLLRTTLLPIAANASTQKALRAGDTNTLLATWQPVFKAMSQESAITHFSFFDTNRVCLLRVHSPKKRGDINSRHSALEAERTGKTASSVKLGPYGDFIARVVQPVFTDNGLIGYAELGMEITNAFDTIRNQTDTHIVATFRKNNISRTEWEEGLLASNRKTAWDNLPSSVIVHNSLGHLPTAFNHIIKQHDSMSKHGHGELGREIDFDSKKWILSSSPIYGAHNNEIGDLFIIRNITEEQRAFSHLLALSATVCLVMLALFLSVIYALLRNTDRNIRDQQIHLRESEEKFRLLIENSHDIIYMLSSNGIITYVSPAWTALLGHPTQQIIGKYFPQLVHPDDLPNCKEWLQKVIEAEHRQDGVEYRIQHVDGSWRWHTSSAVAIRRAGGGIIGFEGTARDITQLKQDESQIRTLLDESNKSRLALLGILEDQSRTEADRKRLTMAFEQVSEVIVITDAQGLVQYVNPAFETVTGYSQGETLGQSLRLLNSGQHDDDFYRELWSTIRSGTPWHGRFINKKKNGEIYTEEATISPVRNDAGEIVNYIAVKRDITEHLSLHMQLSQAQKMESIGRLAGGMAHDFNNMLMAIMGYTDLVRKELPPSHPSREYLDEITQASKRSADLTQQLLAFARRQTIVPKVLNLNETVADMLNLLRRIIGENINLKWIPGPDLWPVKLDPSQLDQLTTNLCVNARDAIDGVGNIILETSNATIDTNDCETHTGLTPGDYVIMKVSDDGCGMTNEIRDHIFEPFFTTKSVGEGTGLGLATVYGIIKQNNGFIYCESDLGKGTTFSIYLPRHQGKISTVASSVSITEDIPQGMGETVLVVEDEEMPRKLCTRFLNSLGYNTLVAESPDDAISLVAKYPGTIHLLLTDVIMPGMNGRDLADELMSRIPRLKCLFMSGYTSDILSNHGVMNKDLQFLPKPFSRGALARKIRETLGTTATA